MKNDALSITLWFIGLTLVQILFLNNLNIAGVINIFVYIYLIISLPSNINRYALLFIGFVAGMIIDLFSSTWGMHTAATTLIAYIRPFMLRRFEVLETKHIVPSLKSMKNYTLYASILIVLHSITLFSLEAFSLVLLPTAFLKALISAALSLIVILAIEKLRATKK